jgi:hypothetical protein
MAEGHGMQHPARVIIVGILSIGSLLYSAVLAQVGKSSSPQALPIMGQPPAVILPPPRVPYLPVMPYPYPRVHVYPIVPTSPIPDSSTTSRSPSGIILGYLRLEVNPADAEIYVDGHFIGRGSDPSGPFIVPVAPGGHRVEFRAGGIGSRVHVFVSAGETVDLRRQLDAGHPEKPTPTVKRWMIPARRQASP